MLEKIRKYSSSVFAKIFLFIVAIPFVFWGMGDLFSGGNQNTIAKIDSKKISTQDFVNYLNSISTINELNDKNLIQRHLSNFIGDKLVSEETEYFNILLTDRSLSKIIKNQEMFKKDNEFSRTLYEKFLVENSINAVTLEKNILREEKKKQLLNFIGGGILPSKASVNQFYNKENQKRSFQLIDLNEAFKSKTDVSEKEIQLYYEKNKNNYKEVYKSLSFLELNSKNLTEDDDYNDLFFKKIDEIDDLIINGKNLKYILEKLNLEGEKSIALNKLGINKNFEKINNFPTELIENIFKLDKSDPVILIENKNKYFIIELLDTEIIQKNIDDKNVKSEISSSIKKEKRKKLVVELIAKINNNNFSKLDFDNFSKSENVSIKKISLKNKNDNKKLNKDLVDQIYTYPKNKVIAVSDLGMSKNYLVYIDKVENVSIDESSPDYQNYLKISEARIRNSLYNTYDKYLSKKYEIDINHKALDILINNF
tara:strand:+ start:193 stop:1638 length:1446 start_codon:yes stop_codon:yes gene_type:complete